MQPTIRDSRSAGKTADYSRLATHTLLRKLARIERRDYTCGCSRRDWDEYGQIRAELERRQAATGQA